MERLIDLEHLGNDRVIAACDLDGLIVDPGPSSCLENLLAGLEGEPRALLLTHIHLDHAGASGSLVRRFPDLRVYVHEIGARHLIDPGKLLESAGRLYGDDLERLWGEVAPVPAENVIALQGGEDVEGLRVAHCPGHADHHVAYLDPSSGTAYVGDVAGVRIPPTEFTVAPTPPPDIDLAAWEESIRTIAAWRPERLLLTHFGPFDDVDGQLAQVREALARSAERARTRERGRFLADLESEIDRALDAETAVRLRQAAPPEQGWLGLERYWRKRSAT
ncbi:MAG TPA: MBL fold metallo-hydrolase [Solirubrobacterales bacterium]|nr:MBL fold metallo-hydrolase [Solirubrobacterales bacterium]